MFAGVGLCGAFLAPLIIFSDSSTFDSRVKIIALRFAPVVSQYLREIWAPRLKDASLAGVENFH